MSSASSGSSGSRRAVIAGVIVVIAAAGAFSMSRPSATVAPVPGTAGPQDIVARGRIEPLGRVIVVNAPADSPVKRPASDILVGRDQRGAYAVAQGWLWVDGVRVYHAPDLALRIVSGVRAQS